MIIRRARLTILLRIPILITLHQGKHRDKPLDLMAESLPGDGNIDSQPEDLPGTKASKHQILGESGYSVTVIKVRLLHYSAQETGGWQWPCLSG